MDSSAVGTLKLTHSTVITSGDQVGILVNILHNVTLYDIVVRFDFDISYVGTDPYPIVVHRYQWITHTICYGTAQAFTVPFPPPFLYMIPSNMRKVDVYSLYSLTSINSAISYTGYNRGTCRAIISGPFCLPKQSRYPTTTIKYFANSIFLEENDSFGPNKLDVTMKITPQCASQCSLKVVIQEQLLINVYHHWKSRRHEWLDVYHVTWQAMRTSGEKERFVLLDITPMCPSLQPCTTKLCDIAIAIGFPLTDNELVRLPSTNILKYWKTVDNFKFSEKTALEKLATPVPKGIVSSDLTYGNWYDARDHCISQNASLFSLTRSFSRQLQDVINSEDLDLGWNNIGEYFFAGLHRQDEVRVMIKQTLEFDYYLPGSRVDRWGATCSVW